LQVLTFTLSLSMAAQSDTDLHQSGVLKLMGILQGHLSVMEERDAAVEKVISSADTADDLREAKKNALAVETELLLSIMNNISELNSFLNDIILIENLFNESYAPYKAKQEAARKKYAAGIEKFDKGTAKQSDKKTVTSEATSFVTLMFAASNALNPFQKWLDEKVLAQCNEQGIKMKDERPRAKLKGMERAFYKSFYVYGRNDDEGYKRMSDLVRVSLVFDTFDELYRCYAIIEALGGVLRVKDRYHPRSVPFGYRDLLVNVMCPRSKIVAEIQLHFQLFYRRKKISHKMYKRARLFDRAEGNLAYDYADEFLRKSNEGKVYDLSEEDAAGGSNEEDSFKTLLHHWGLAAFADGFEKEGYDDPALWSNIDEEALRELGMGKGHIMKWKMQIQKLSDRQKLKEEREEKADDGHFENLYYFKGAKTVVIQHRHNGTFQQFKSLHAVQGGIGVAHNGGKRAWAQFRVEPKGQNKVMIKNLRTGKYLRIRDRHGVDVGGEGGVFCHFKVVQQAKAGVVMLQAIKTGKYLSVKEDGVFAGDPSDHSKLKFWRKN